MNNIDAGRPLKTAKKTWSFFLVDVCLVKLRFYGIDWKSMAARLKGENIPLQSIGRKGPGTFFLSRLKSRLGDGSDLSYLRISLLPLSFLKLFKTLKKNIMERKLNLHPEQSAVVANETKCQQKLKTWNAQCRDRRQLCMLLKSVEKNSRETHVHTKKKPHSRGWFRSIDLWVMGPARSRCATLLCSIDTPPGPVKLQYSLEPGPTLVDMVTTEFGPGGQ